MKNSKYPVGKGRRHCKATYRSGLEEVTGRDLTSRSVPFKYEGLTIKYLIPAIYHTYKPDFPLLHNGIIIETKGIFDSADRQKHVYIKEQYPELDIRFVFTNPNNKLYKGSKTTYAMWCEKNGFKWAAKVIPEEWLKEPQKPYLNYLKKCIEEGIPYDSGRESSEVFRNR